MKECRKTGEDRRPVGRRPEHPPGSLRGPPKRRYARYLSKVLSLSNASLVFLTAASLNSAGL